MLSSPSEEECHLLKSLTNFQYLIIYNLNEIEALTTGLASNTTLQKLHFCNPVTDTNTLYYYLYSSLTTNYTLKGLECLVLNTCLELDPNNIPPHDDMIVEEIEEFYLADLIKENHTIEDLCLVIDTFSEK